MRRRLSGLGHKAIWQRIPVEQPELFASILLSVSLLEAFDSQILNLTRWRLAFRIGRLPKTVLDRPSESGDRTPGKDL